MASESGAFSLCRRYFRAYGIHLSDEHIALLKQQFLQTARFSFGLALCFHHDLGRYSEDSVLLKLPVRFTTFTVLREWDPDHAAYKHLCPASSSFIFLSYTKKDPSCTQNHDSHFQEDPVHRSCGVLFCNQEVSHSLLILCNEKSSKD